MPDFHHTIGSLGSHMGTVLSTTIARLVVAAILGGVIGLERELRHKPAGLRTNMFICFGSAMFTLLSDQLAGGFGGDHTRVAAQIIPGIGFIGAGSILHSRGSVTGLTTAATLFVVASIGMAVGGGEYLPALFAALVILVALNVLGWAEQRFNLKSSQIGYAITAADPQKMLNEVNQLLSELGIALRSVNLGDGGGGTHRLHFTVDAKRDQHDRLVERLQTNHNLQRLEVLRTAE